MAEETVAVKTAQGNEYYVPKSVAASGSYNGEQIVAASGMYNSSTGTTSTPPPIPKSAPQYIMVRNAQGQEFYQPSDKPITPEQNIIEVLIPGAGPGGGAYVEKAPQDYVLTSPGWKATPQTQNVQTAPRQMTDFEAGLLGLPDFTPKEKTMTARGAYISGVISKNELQAAESAQGGEVIYTVPVGTLAVARKAQYQYPVVSETHSPLGMAQAAAERTAINEEERQKNIYESAQSPEVQAGYAAKYSNPVNAFGVMLSDVGPKVLTGTWDTDAQHQHYMNYVQGLYEKEPEYISGTFEVMGKPIFTGSVPFDSMEALGMGIGVSSFAAAGGAFGPAIKTATTQGFTYLYGATMGLEIGGTIKDPTAENVARTGIYAAIPFVGYGIAKGVPKVINWMKGGNPKPTPTYVEAAKSDVILDTTGTTADAYTKTMTLTDTGKVATTRVKSQMQILETEFGTKRVYGIHEYETSMPGSAKSKGVMVTRDEMVVKGSGKAEGIGDLALGTSESKTVQIGVRARESAGAGFFASVKTGQAKSPEGVIELYNPEVKGEPARPFNKVETFASTAYGVAGKKGVIFSEVAAGEQGPVIQMDAAFVGESARRGATLGKTDVYSLMEEPKKSSKFEPEYGILEPRGEVSSSSGRGTKADLMGDSMQRFVQGADQAKMLGFESGRAAAKGGQKPQNDMLAMIIPESKVKGRRASGEKDAFDFAFGIETGQRSSQGQQPVQEIDIGLGLGPKTKHGMDSGERTSQDRFIIPVSGMGFGMKEDIDLGLGLKQKQTQRSRLKLSQATGFGFDFGFGKGKQPPPEKFFAPPWMEQFNYTKPSHQRPPGRKRRGYYYLHKNPVMSPEEFLGFGSKRGRKRR